MKLNLSILALFLCMNTFSQNLFEVNDESPVFPPKEVSIDVSNLSAEDKYELIKDWLSTNFNEGENLVKDQICSNYIALTSTVNDLYTDNSHLFKNDYDVKYELTFRCVDNKICIEIKELKVHFPKTISSGGWEDISIAYEDLFRKNGEVNLKKKETLERLQTHFNKVVYGLENHITSSNSYITYNKK